MFFHLFHCWETEFATTVHFSESQVDVIHSPLPCIPSIHRYILFVPSRTEDRQLRSVIRRTWMMDFVEDVRFKVFFVLAGPTSYEVEREIQNEKDILQINTIDSYYNITHKIHQAFKWIVSNCRYAQLVVRADPDVALIKSSLLSYLSRKRPFVRTIVGYCRRYDCVMRVPFSKTCTAFKHYWKHFYPPYCFGFTYLLSADLLKPLLASWPPNYFHLDDILVTGLLPELLGTVKLVNEPPLFNSEQSFDTYPCEQLPISARSYSNVELLEQRWKEHKERCRQHSSSSSNSYLTNGQHMRVIFFCFLLCLWMISDCAT
ncbi:trafficking protein particle complex subunit 4 [Trichuris trichiura]|uniref:Hexosyltransferase n=1 Tax=Trichuris trichiura TaxID=36087 RepID=A0A077Z7S8_TRITR|nr:trafficking protein particle complex subunit 4 [Trichuris trichiura]